MPGADPYGGWGLLQCSLEVLGLGRVKGKKILVVRAAVWESEMLPVAVDQSDGVMLARSHRGKVNAKAVQSILQAVLGEG